MDSDVVPVGCFVLCMTQNRNFQRFPHYLEGPNPMPSAHTTYKPYPSFGFISCLSVPLKHSPGYSKLHPVFQTHNIQNMLTYSPHPLIRQFLQLNLVTPFKQTEWQERWCLTSMCWETQVSCHIIEEPNLPPTSHVRAPPWQWSTQPSSAFKGYIYNLPIRLYLSACSTETREKVPFLL